MSIAGKVIECEGKTLFVFGSTKVVSWSASFPDTYHIGVNLDTGKVDDVKKEHPAELHFHELTDSQQLLFSKFVPVHHALKKRVMAVTAKARSGKDLLAEQVSSAIRRLPGTKVVALGDAIRSVRTVLFGEPKGKDRATLIMIGQGLRNEDPNIWLKVWLSKAIEAVVAGEARSFICQDVRQPNEFKFFESLGALTVKIEADEEKRLNKIREVDGEAALDARLLNDETESHFGGFDAEITLVNNYDNYFLVAITDKVIPALLERGW